MRTTIIRRAHFNAAHRVYRKDWSDEKNREVFGPCSNPRYHGHNYSLEVQVTGLVDPTTGYVMDLRDLKQIIEEQVIRPFDHRNLNLDTEEFRDLNPTAENIARVIYEKIRKVLPHHLDLRIRLMETENNLVEYPA
ncbi:MAG: 6-carboxytetrahydropterin synthase [Chitinophagales bacterium]|nr:6-carboxytetrahydropterin synthase [Chitinophagales bacterium]MDW8427775.1 6-carboxytetrahydropterin synthase [Chitinophagales bacterium]